MDHNTRPDAKADATPDATSGVKADARLSFLEKVNKYTGMVINSLEVGLLVTCVAALAVLLMANVFARTFFQSIYFAEEVAKFLVILITFAGISYGVRKARHIRMGAFLDAMPMKLEKAFIIFICLVSSIVMGIMAWYSWEYLLNAMQRSHMTPALRVPKWTFYIIIPFGFGISAIQYLRTIIKNITENEAWQSPDQQSEYEDEITGGPV